MDILLFSISIIALIISVVAHEVSHGYAAEQLGDPTARLAGRLTLNPVSHFDLLGSFIVPTMSFFLGGFIFGWAKPVPYNPHNLSNQKYGEAIVAAAGPAMNILIAVVFGLLIRFADVLGLPASFIDIASMVVYLNIILAFFNLLPIPPLDGSKILFTFLPYRFYQFQQQLEQYGFFAVLLVVFFLWQLIFPIIDLLFRLLTGL